MHIPGKITLDKIKKPTEEAPVNVSSHIKSSPLKHSVWILIKPICRCFIQTNHSCSKGMLSTLQTFHCSWPPGNSEAASSWKSLLPNNSKENSSAAGKAPLMAEGGLCALDIHRAGKSCSAAGALPSCFTPARSCPSAGLRAASPTPPRCGAGVWGFS